MALTLIIESAEALSNVHRQSGRAIVGILIVAAACHERFFAMTNVPWEFATNEDSCNA